jgi:exodeoxyribonuclease V alpha subunit
MLEPKHSPVLHQGVLEQLTQSGKIRAIDQAFADFIYSQEQDLDLQGRACISMLAAYLSARAGQQHSCVSLNLSEQPFLPAYQFPPPQQLLTYVQQAHSILLLTEQGQNSDPEFGHPMVIQNKQMYLQRYWQYEVDLADIISQRAGKIHKIDTVVAAELLATLFPEPGDPLEQSLDWQKIAVALAASQNLSFITGGPGTGKTTTVTKLLALLQGLAHKNNSPLAIELVAPTGKAAARLTESISAAKQKLPVALQRGLPEQCQTIHRLLGAKPQSPYFKANAQTPLHLDVLVLDEGSMVDLPLMVKLFAAIPEHAQVILLGDQDQLASVETGSVLSDICAAKPVLGQDPDAVLAGYSPSMQNNLALLKVIPEPSPQILSQATSEATVIQDNVVNLLKSHRFDAQGGIGQLARCFKTGDLKIAMALLQDTAVTDIDWYSPNQSAAVVTVKLVREQILKHLISALIPVYKEYAQAIQLGDLAGAFACLTKQQVLCAEKSGYWGVVQINDLIEAELHKQGIINKDRDFYSGRPIMLAKNDHQLKLFNGDMGVVMADPYDPSLLKVWFINPDGKIRGLLPSRLPEHDTLFAMTIHKSQGSEFESVHLCLPYINHLSGGRGLTRELLYTGLTRAKQHFSLYAQPQALSLALNQQSTRGSGLSQRLMGT